MGHSALRWPSRRHAHRAATWRCLGTGCPAWGNRGSYESIPGERYAGRHSRRPSVEICARLCPETTGKVRSMRLKFFATLLASGATAASAAQFPLVDAGALMFGDVETITAHAEDTLPDLARRYGLGYEEILRANPGVDTWLPGEGTTIVIPGQRLLPPGVREGIVVNLPEHRLYYFPKPKKGEV